jgi:hypothetical protein
MVRQTKARHIVVCLHQRDIGSLPLTDAEFEADFFLHPKYSTKRHERWAGMVIERGPALPGDHQGEETRRPGREEEGFGQGGAAAGYQPEVHGVEGEVAGLSQMLATGHARQNETVIRKGERNSNEAIVHHPLGVHSGHWAMLGAELYEATGEERYRRNVLNTANYITYLLQPDNRIPVGRDWKEKELWYSCHFGPVLFLMELLGHFPECAPDGESHLLHASGAVQAIYYEPNRIVYSTDTPSQDVLRLAFIPSEIVVNGKLLPAGDGTRRGWKLDPRTRVLRLVHEAGRVVIHVQR